LTHIGAAGLANWVFFPHPLAANRSGQLALGADTNKSAVPADTDEVAKRVRQEFLHAWNAYKQYAWGHDELRPLSKSYRDWYALPLYMTPVDSLDTMIIMGIQDEAESTREFIAKHLTFNCDISVKNFEITIRMLGGLLSS
jgi:hypothetical protein